MSTYLLKDKTILQKSKSLVENYIPAEREFFELVPAETKDLLIKQQKCKVPKLDPFDADILPYLKEARLQKCKNKKYGEVNNEILRVKAKDVVAVFLYYIKRIDDFKIHLSERRILFSHENQSLRKLHIYVVHWQASFTVR